MLLSPLYVIALRLTYAVIVGGSVVATINALNYKLIIVYLKILRVQDLIILC